MSDDDKKINQTWLEFLTGWLMEFGAEPVSKYRYQKSVWWKEFTASNHFLIEVPFYNCARFFDRPEPDLAGLSAQALEFIRTNGGNHESSN